MFTADSASAEYYAAETYDIPTTENAVSDEIPSGEVQGFPNFGATCPFSVPESMMPSIPAEYMASDNYEFSSQGYMAGQVADPEPQQQSYSATAQANRTRPTRYLVAPLCSRPTQRALFTHAHTAPRPAPLSC
jgi:hypothetical protein